VRALSSLAVVGAVAACAPATPSPSAPVVSAHTTVLVEGPPVHESLQAVDAYQPPPPLPDPPSPPSVVPTYPGGIPASAVRYRVKRCYTSSLATNPDLAGKVKIELVLGRDGAVRRARDVGSTLPDPTVIACILSTLARIQFEPFASGDEAVVVLPFTFVPR
jgi:hypothetical protein